MNEKLIMQTQERLDMAKIVFTPEQFKKYLVAPDVLEAASPIPVGYKYCTKCHKCKKITMFNKNSNAKDGCTSRCKDCQKENAHKNYKKNAPKRSWRKYYEAHKEEKRAQSRQYYQEHKAELAKKHAIYRNTAKGKKVMERAHAKRAKMLTKNVGIPYTRELVIDRDKQGGTEPICYLCGKPITGTPHLDHVIPVVMGGKDCFTNIACTHDTCNLVKSKDAREITAEQVEALNALSEAYMDAHKGSFPEIFGNPNESSESDKAKD